MKSEKICLKKKFMILWVVLAAILAAIFLLSILITAILYSEYKKGQDCAIAYMLDSTDQFNEYKDNKKELVNEIYKYFNPWYPGIDFLEYYEKVRDRGTEEWRLEVLLRAEGYDEGERASYYFEYTNYSSYYRHKSSNYLYRNFYFKIIYGIICGISLILNILYILNRKVEIKVSDNNITYKKITGKTKQFMIKDITCVETIILKGLKLNVNGIKVKTLLLKNDKELKDYIIKLILNDSNTNINTSMADELEKFKKLLDSGTITQEEYNKKKEKILNF